jgi:hypothetical protein
LASKKLKTHNSPGIHQIPAELVKAGGMANRSNIRKIIKFCME